MLQSIQKTLALAGNIIMEDAQQIYNRISENPIKELSKNSKGNTCKLILLKYEYFQDYLMSWRYYRIMHYFIPNVPTNFLLSQKLPFIPMYFDFYKLTPDVMVLPAEVIQQSKLMHYIPSIE